MEKTCKQLINQNLKSRIDDLSRMWSSDDYTTPEGESLYEYGLSFDYVPAEGRKRGYFRYQLSWGGPSDEFRIYAEGRGYKWNVDRIEYVYMDWYDIAKRTLTGKNLELVENIFLQFFTECGSTESVYNTAMDNQD